MGYFLKAFFAGLSPSTSGSRLMGEVRDGGLQGVGGFEGRVTKAMAGLEFDPQTTDFYVCGSAAMVADCRTILERAGAARILIEPYVKAVVEWQQRMLAEGHRNGFLSIDKIVERGYFGPMGASWTKARFLHFPTVFGLIP